jgi:hypothetical protein
LPKSVVVFGLYSVCALRAASDSLLPAVTSLAAPVEFRDPGESDVALLAELSSSEVGSEVGPDAAAAQAQTLTEKLLALKLVKMGLHTYDSVAETFGAPKLEVVYSETMEVVGTFKTEGMVAATKAGVSKSYAHTSKAVAHTYDMTKTGAAKAKQHTYETTAAALEAAAAKGAAAAARGVNFSKPYVSRAALLHGTSPSAVLQSLPVYTSRVYRPCEPSLTVSALSPQLSKGTSSACWRTRRFPRSWARCWRPPSAPAAWSRRCRRKRKRRSTR